MFNALSGADLKVWYFPMSRKYGEDLLKDIEEGIKHSMYSILIITKDYMRKRWTETEFRIIVSQAINLNKNFFVIWDNVTWSEVHNFSPYLATYDALNTKEKNLDEIALELGNRIKGLSSADIKYEVKSFKRAEKGRYRKLQKWPILGFLLRLSKT